MYSAEIIVTSLREVYEHSCPFLSIDEPYYDKKRRPIAITKYVKQFWGSKRKNKITAQNLITSDDLLSTVRKADAEITDKVVLSVISELIEVGAFWLVEVDVNGSNIKKLLLSPLGFELWRSIDEGTLLNQKQVSHQYFRQILTQERLFATLQAENVVWRNVNQKRLVAPEGLVSSQLVCLGLYLLLNGAIDRDHALHLVRTSNKDFEWHNTLVKGLNVVAQTLFDKELFKEHSLKDDLQRRSGLISKVGSSLKWLAPSKGGKDEYYWWEIGEYNHDSSVLDHIARTLIRSASSGNELSSIENCLKMLVDYFRNGVGYQLPRFEMSKLFPKEPAHDYDYALQASIDRVLAEFTQESEEALNLSKRQRGSRRHKNN